MRKTQTKTSNAGQVESEAIQLQAQLGSASPQKARALLSQLVALASLLQMNGRRSQRAASIIAAAIAQAQQLAEDIDSTRCLSPEEREKLIDLHVYNQMSGEAKQFYDNIDTDIQYCLAQVAAGGKIVANDIHIINGADLRHAFSAIAFHSLSEGERTAIITKVDGTNKTTAKDYKKAKADIHHLKTALHAMEAYKASLLVKRFGNDTIKAHPTVPQNHDIFALAHMQVDEVMVHYDTLARKPDDHITLAALNVSQERMRKTLKDEVMDKVLLEISDSTIDVQVSIDVPPALPGLLMITAAMALKPKQALPVYVHG